jgi:hypothetical protein
MRLKLHIQPTNSASMRRLSNIILNKNIENNIAFCEGNLLRRGMFCMSYKLCNCLMKLSLI